MDIFLDVDGVVADFITGALFVDEFYDLFCDARVKESEIATYKFYELAGIDSDDWESWLYKSDEAFWSDLPLTDDAISVVDVVAKFDAKFKFLSHAVNNSAKVGKHYWIKNKLNRLSSNLICVDDADDKPRFCTGRDSVLIDDLPANCAAWVDAGGVAILWGKKWNQEKNRGYPVANSVAELEDCLVAIAMAGDLPAKLVDDVMVVNESTGGRKGSKPERLDLLPPAALCELARVYDFGASKYEPNNYRLGYNWSLSMAALLRHVFAFQEGEDDDDESGFCHLAHAAFHCLAIIQSIHDHGDRFDDRYKREL